MSKQQRPTNPRSYRFKYKRIKNEAGSLKSEMAELTNNDELAETNDHVDGICNYAADISSEENTNQFAGRFHERHEESHNLPNKMSTACPENEELLNLLTAESDVSNDSVEQSSEENMQQNFERSNCSQQRSAMFDILRKSNRKIHRNKKSEATSDVEFEGTYIKHVKDEALKKAHKSVFQCFECVLPLPVSHVDQIEPGDHVVFSGLIYNHHGIITSKEGDKLEIIEATNSVCGAILGIFKIFGGKAKIAISQKTFDFKRKKISVVKYNERLKPEETVSRAKEIAAEKFEYDLFRNNCEHFATYCVTGRRISVQVAKLRLAWKLFRKSGFVGISNESKRNDMGFEKKMICTNCYLMNKHLLNVKKRPINKEKDIEEGDIIQFKYWNLWHDAVILTIGKKTNKNVVCTIAHYAFHGPFFHRILTEDKINIRLNGTYLKLDYSSPDYNVFPPEEVVGRALEGIVDRGQPFVFFANDSSHFARWCKLKRDVNEGDV